MPGKPQCSLYPTPSTQRHIFRSAPSIQRSSVGAAPGSSCPTESDTSNKSGGKPDEVRGIGSGFLESPVWNFQQWHVTRRLRSEISTAEGANRETDERH